VAVRGSYGTKLEAVVRRVLHLLARCPSERVLVFSSWADALELLAHALAANRVAFACPRASGRGLQEALAAFKGGALLDGEAAEGLGGEWAHAQARPEEAQQLGAEAAEELGAVRPATPPPPPEQQQPPPPPFGLRSLPAEAPSLPGPSLPPPVPGHLDRKGGRAHGRRRAGQAPPAPAPAPGPPRVLLLLLGQGGKGLNLTEAQHVVLLEPILDPALEAQAIGRVHRIGQRRETHVHRCVHGRGGAPRGVRCCAAAAAAAGCACAWEQPCRRRPLPAAPAAAGDACGSGAAARLSLLPLLSPNVWRTNAPTHARPEELRRPAAGPACRFVTLHTTEDNVHQLCQQRAAAMDLHAAAVAKGRAAQDVLSAGDVAALLNSEWEAGQGEAQLDSVVRLD
jgi:hypothetical protein